MKKILLLLFLFSFEICSAQQWFPLEGGLSGNDAQNNKVCSLCTDTINHVLYVGGYFKYCHNDTGIVSVINIGKWDGVNWNPLLFYFDSSFSTIGFGQTITSMIFHGTEIYFTSSDDINNGYGIFKFDVNDFHYSRIGYFNGSLNSLCFYNDSLYVGGNFTQFQTCPTCIWHNTLKIAKWQGINAQWEEVGTGISGGAVPEVHALCVHHNKLYAAGIFENAGGTYCKNIACWNDTSWSAVGNGIGFSGDFGVILFAVESYHNKLYAGGYFDSSSTGFAHCVAVWNDTTWASAGVHPAEFIL